MADSDVWALTPSLWVFAAAALVTLLGGIRLASTGDTLADRLGWGEALFGAIVFGGVTSLSGIVMTATAAYEGHAGLAYSNAVGGIAAQTTALVAADLFLRGANLEHAAASLVSVFFAVLLIGMMTLSLAIRSTADVTIAGVHPGSAVLVAVYLYGMRLSRQVRAHPLWHPERTAETREDVPDDEGPRRSTRSVSIEFVVMAVLVAGSGWAVAQAAGAVVVHTALTETTVGALLMGVTNALPETVTAIAAVRRGALTLALAGVIGGNAFDVLNLVVGDIAYREGSLYHGAGADDVLVTLVSILMTSVLVAGMIRRQVRGPVNIGFESWTVLVLYVVMVLMLAFGGGRA